MLNTKLLLELAADYTNPLDLATGLVPLAFTRSINLATGTGANQADKIWHDERSLNASATEDLDLSGALTDAFGVTVTMARVKGLVIAASPLNTNNVVVGAAASNAWAALLNATGTLTIRPGGVSAHFATDATAHVVTAGTGDLLKVANSGAGSSVIYDIVVIGCSA
jgi:hypothetical protein